MPDKITVLILALLTKVVTPISIAILTYFVVDRLGEWKRRRSVSALGVVVIDSLLEELRTGLSIMRQVLAAIDDPDASFPGVRLLPYQTWDGMQTLSDDVILRIIAIAPDGDMEGFRLQDLRTHCKNYFTHMRSNYELAITDAARAASGEEDWRRQLEPLLRSGQQPYIQAAQKVANALQRAKELLAANSRRWWWPR